MANTKISALSAATTLTGTEVIPVVQGGVTKKVTTDQFLIKDASGNLGLGVTPYAWGSSYKAIDIGSMGIAGMSNAVLNITSNAYDNGTNYIYKATAAATLNLAINGEHRWYTAPSGTAGNTISFTQVMGLNASGVLTLTPSINQALVLDHAGGSYATWQLGGTSLGDVGISNQVLSGGSSADFAVSSRTGALVLGTGNVERARIDASGNLLVGTTSTNPTNGVVVNQNSGAGAYTQIGHPTGTVSGVAYERFMFNQTEIGSITQNGTTAVLYNTSSDARLKENISNADNGSALIDGLQVRKFDWKSDGSHQRFGFIAQELDAVYPEAVSKPADPDEMMGVDYSKLVPLLVQEIQSLRARLAAAGI